MLFLPPTQLSISQRSERSLYQCSTCIKAVFQNAHSTYLQIEFLLFLKWAYQKVVKSLQQKFCLHLVEISSHTSLSDHCNSDPSSPSVIYSEPLLSILVRCNRVSLVQNFR